MNRRRIRSAARLRLGAALLLPLLALLALADPVARGLRACHAAQNCPYFERMD